MRFSLVTLLLLMAALAVFLSLWSVTVFDPYWGMALACLFAPTACWLFSALFPGLSVDVRISLCTGFMVAMAGLFVTLSLWSPPEFAWTWPQMLMGLLIFWPPQIIGFLGSLEGGPRKPDRSRRQELLRQSP